MFLKASRCLRDPFVEIYPYASPAHLCSFIYSIQLHCAHCAHCAPAERVSIFRRKCFSKLRKWEDIFSFLWNISFDTFKISYVSNHGWRVEWWQSWTRQKEEENAGTEKTLSYLLSCVTLNVIPGNWVGFNYSCNFSQGLHPYWGLAQSLLNWLWEGRYTDDKRKWLFVLYWLSVAE